jgi:hypothetical protein
MYDVNDGRQPERSVSQEQTGSRGVWLTSDHLQLFCATTQNIALSSRKPLSTQLHDAM